MSRTYYCPSESLVFVTEEDVRNFFFNEKIYEVMEDESEFDLFLSERYSRVTIFRMTDEERAEVIADYNEILFEQWKDEELIDCDIYAE